MLFYAKGIEASQANRQLKEEKKENAYDLKGSQDVSICTQIEVMNSLSGRWPLIKHTD